MRARLKQLFAAAVVLIVGGATVTVGLRQAAQDMTPRYTKAEWRRASVQLYNPVLWRRVFIAVDATITEIPETAGDIVLGECSNPDRECCIYGQCYPFDFGPAVTIGPKDWRLVEVKAHPLILGGFKEWAVENGGASSGSVRWLGAFKDFESKCLAITSGANCLALADADNRCWLLDDGSVCRYGRHLGTGTQANPQGDPCPYATIAAPAPCTCSGSARCWRLEAERELTDSDMGL